MISFGRGKLIEPIEDVRYRSDVCSVRSPELRQWIRDQSWTCRTWTDAPSTDHPPHDHPYAHRVLCVSGWIEFTVENRTHRLMPGDTLDLPSGVTHSATTHPEEPTEYWLLQPSGESCS